MSIISGVPHAEEAEGVNTMCELMEKFGENKMEEGRIESARRTATALLALGKLTLSQIAEATTVTGRGKTIGRVPWSISSCERPERMILMIFMLYYWHRWFLSK